MNIDIGHLASWEGRTETRTERIGAAPACAMAALMDRSAPGFDDGDSLPAGWQWLYFLPLARQSELGPDGHPRRGGFLPPVPLERRMWASGSMRIESPLCIGETVTRTSRIDSVRLKEGRTSGPMIIVTLAHELATRRGRRISETQVLVYRGDTSVQPQPSRTPAPSDEIWRHEFVPDPVLLFRYSALSFNGHRIHYDRDYAMQVEHYPALVVQGPLAASMLLELLARELPARRVTRFEFRALRPLYDGQPFSVCAKPAPQDGQIALWTRDADGMVTMEAQATLE